MAHLSVFAKNPNYLKIGANLAMTTFNLSQICPCLYARAI